MIPAFLTIDVEPDGFQLPPRGPASWTGFDAVEDFVEPLRDALASVGPAPPQFCWLFRMDPQIAETTGRADHAVSAYRHRVDRIAQRGDVLGVHVHPVRWSTDTQQWIHDFIDMEFNAHCVESAVTAFEGALGYQPLIHRYGGGILPSVVVEKLDELGVRVDVTLEPRSLSPQRRTHLVDVESGIDGTPSIGVMRDCARLPRTAYRPSHADELSVDDANGRDIVMLPMTAARRRYEKPMWWRTASRAKHRFRRPPVRMMYPSVPWPSPKLFWDIVEREIERMPRPYVLFSSRTDKPGSADNLRARAVLEYLPSHPLARRLRFTDPIAAVPSLLAPRARRTLAWADALLVPA